MNTAELCVPARFFPTSCQTSNGQAAASSLLRGGSVSRAGRSRQLGFSIVEVMMSLVLLAVGTALALPSYHEMVEKRQITHGAEQIMAFVNTAQGEAAKRNEVLWVSFDRDDDDEWCIGASIGASACDCEQTSTVAADYCAIDAVPWLIDDALLGATLQVKSISSAGADMYRFDPIRGIACAADIDGDCVADTDELMAMELRSNAEDFRLNLTVSRTGQVVLCSKDDSHKIPGYPVCPPVAVAQEESV